MYKKKRSYRVAFILARYASPKGNIMYSIRVFFALDLPPNIKEIIAKILSQLQKNNHPSTILRYTQLNNLHLTLQFLAKIKADDLSSLISHVRKQLQNLPTFEMQLQNNIEYFPSLQNPKVISLSIESNSALLFLVKKIGEGIIETGYDIEQRIFRAHLTLARVKHTEKLCHLGDIIMPMIPPIVVREVILYHSEPTREGSNYIALEKISLMDL